MAAKPENEIDNLLADPKFRDLLNESGDSFRGEIVLLIGVLLGAGAFGLGVAVYIIFLR